MTIEELDALPVGSKLAEAGFTGVLWVKYPDGTWHFIEQEDGWAEPGKDWSGSWGDTSGSVARGANLSLVVE